MIGSENELANEGDARKDGPPAPPPKRKAKALAAVNRAREGPPPQGGAVVRGKVQATLDLDQALLAIVEERAPITVRGIAYALFTLSRISSLTLGQT